ncbi:MAG: hypothetical protein HQL48_07415, partial [Gammaproteobacteria bacterium]|nr:hypothetical protein [Gammaproteobacteria bacterium]
MTSNSQAQLPKVYKFALFGATGSGKTVFLAALAMNRISYHPSFSCTRVPLGKTHNEDARNATKPAQDRIAALQEGKDWLDRVIEALENEEMPPPNPPDHADMLFEFELCTGSRSYRLEFLDYAGELVHSSQAANENARGLRSKLRGMDALLVMAPAPWPEQDYIALDENLTAIRETFMLLKGEKGDSALQLPVVLLFDKWDRRSMLEYQTPENEHKELADFLEQEPPPPHKTLYTALQSAVSDTANFAAFPVSALGECSKIDLGDGHLADGPPESFKPLRSFGLEDPLVWAAERCDQIDLAEIEGNITFIDTVWKDRWLPWPFPLHRLVYRAANLASRFPAADPNHARAQCFNDRAKSTLRSRYIAFVSLLLSGILAIELGYDGMRYTHNENTWNNPGASSKDLKSAEDWLEGYTESIPLRHSLSKFILLPGDEAEMQLRELRNTGEELAWSRCKDTSKPNEKKQNCQKYTEDYPNGKYITIAARYVGRITFERLYNDLINERRIFDAATRLLQHHSSDEWLVALKHNFEAQALKILNQELDQQLREGAGKITEVLSRLKKADQWPPDLLSDNGRCNLHFLQQKAKSTEDRWLYDEARKYLTPDSLHRYLDSAPLITMQAEVQA